MLLNLKIEDSESTRFVRMKYKTLIIERGARGGRFKKPVTITVPERQTLAEKKLLQYIWESLTPRSCLIPFTVNNVSTMKIARHLLFNRTGSQLSLYRYISHVYNFCKRIQAEPDQLLNKCRNRNGVPNPKGITIMTKALEEHIDYLRTNNNASSTIGQRVKAVKFLFRLNGIDLRLPYGIRGWTVYDDRAPSREEIQKILNVADLRERVIITILAVSGLRPGTLFKLQYRHVKHDLELAIVPIHVHVEAALIKGKRRSYDTFLNGEASECLRTYIDVRKRGSRAIPPEHVDDESPLIRANKCRQVRTVSETCINAIIHDLYFRAGLLERNCPRKKYELRTHSFRKFFRTQMASLGVDRDYIDFMMGRPAKDRYHDVRMKGVEFLRGAYLTSGIRITPQVKMNRIDALKEILQAWGLNPQKILTDEALAQITPTCEHRQADNADLLSRSKILMNHQPGRSLPETGVA
jgi:integrase